MHKINASGSTIPPRGEEFKASYADKDKLKAAKILARLTRPKAPAKGDSNA